MQLCDALAHNKAIVVLLASALSESESQKALGFLVQNNSCIQRLCIDSPDGQTDMSAQKKTDIRDVFTALKVNHTLKSLHVCVDGRDKDFFEVLAGALARNVDLTDLDVHVMHKSARALDGKGLIAIAEAVRDRPRSVFMYVCMYVCMCVCVLMYPCECMYESIHMYVDAKD